MIEKVGLALMGEPAFQKQVCYAADHLGPRTCRALPHRGPDVLKGTKGGIKFSDGSAASRPGVAVQAAQAIGFV
jgi:hypothetical protein